MALPDGAEPISVLNPHERLTMANTWREALSVPFPGALEHLAVDFMPQAFANNLAEMVDDVRSGTLRRYVRYMQEILTFMEKMDLSEGDLLPLIARIADMQITVSIGPDRTSGVPVMGFLEVAGVPQVELQEQVLRPLRKIGFEAKSITFEGEGEQKLVNRARFKKPVPPKVPTS